LYRVYEIETLGTMFFSTECLFSTECFANGTLYMSWNTVNQSSGSNLYRVFVYLPTWYKTFVPSVPDALGKLLYVLSAQYKTLSTD
jgi:hypothetical protein